MAFTAAYVGIKTRSFGFVTVRFHLDLLFYEWE